MASALRIAFPTPVADAGFCPVISLPSTTTFSWKQSQQRRFWKARLSHAAESGMLTPHCSVFWNLPPSWTIRSSTKNGMSYHTDAVNERTSHSRRVVSEHTLTLSTVISSSLVKQVALRPEKIDFPVASTPPTSALQCLSQTSGHQTRTWSGHTQVRGKQQRQLFPRSRTKKLADSYRVRAGKMCRGAEERRTSETNLAFVASKARSKTGPCPPT